MPPGYERLRKLQKNVPTTVFLISTYMYAPPQTCKMLMDFLNKIYLVYPYSLFFSKWVLFSYDNNKREEVRKIFVKF